MKAAPTRMLLLLTLALLVASTAEADPSRCETAWSEPVNLGAPINSAFSEVHTALSPDGLSLYFISNRPGGAGGNDIWVAQRDCASCEWDAPENVTAVNTAFAEGGVSLSPDGRLMFFHSDRPGGHGSLDIYVSRRANPNDDFGWGPPENLGPPVNTANGELGPEYVRKADGYLPEAPGAAAALYFGRGPAIAPGNNQDIYTAPLTRDGEVLGPRPHSPSPSSTH
jgi:hypothetical protein